MAACALVAAALIAAVSAVAVPARAGAALYRIGPEPVPPAGAIVHGPVAAGRRLHVTVTLRPRSPAALAAYARAVSTPGSAWYHAYLTPAQFGRWRRCSDRSGPAACARDRSALAGCRFR